MKFDSVCQSRKPIPIDSTFFIFDEIASKFCYMLTAMHQYHHIDHIYPILDTYLRKHNKEK